MNDKSNNKSNNNNEPISFDEFTKEYFGITFSPELKQAALQKWSEWNREIKITLVPTDSGRMIRVGDSKPNQPEIKLEGDIPLTVLIIADSSKEARLFAEKTKIKSWNYIQPGYEGLLFLSGFVSATVIILSTKADIKKIKELCRRYNHTLLYTDNPIAPDGSIVFVNGSSIVFKPMEPENVCRGINPKSILFDDIPTPDVPTRYRTQQLKKWTPVTAEDCEGFKEFNELLLSIDAYRVPWCYINKQTGESRIVVLLARMLDGIWVKDLETFETIPGENARHFYGEHSFKPYAGELTETIKNNLERVTGERK